MRILFIAPNRIGDTVLSMGVMHHLLNQYPGALITVAVGPTAASLFADVPNVERVVPLIKERFHGHWLKLWRRMVGTGWDMIVDLRNSAISRLLPARRRFILSPAMTPTHRVTHVGQLLGCRPPPEPRVWLGARERRQAETLIQVSNQALALGPTANWGGKIWPVERFADLIRRLTEPGEIFAATPIFLFGAKSEAHLVAPLLTEVADRKVVNLVGQLDLPTVAACFQRTRLFVGNDSGLMHLAAAAGTPTIGLFGPSDENLYRPWGRFTRAVRGPRSFSDITSDPGYDYRQQRCWMTDLSVATVETEIRSLLEAVAAAKK